MRCFPARPLWAIPFLLLAGALSVAGFAPLGQFWLLPLSLVAWLLGIQHAGSTRQALVYGLSWGLGYFLANASWVYISLHTHGGMPVWMAALCTFGFALFLALFPMLAAGLAWRWPAGKALKLALIAPTLFVLSEWIRGWIFTGFPWASLGGSQLATLGGFYPLIGSYGVGWLLAIASGLVLAELRLGASLVFALLSTSALLQQIQWTQPTGAPLRVSLLQGNIPQSMKWSQAAYLDSLNIYRDLTQQSQGQLIVFPETAIPAFFGAIPDWYLDDLRALAHQRQASIIFGTATSSADGQQHFNAAVDLAQPTRTPYAKYHLVPFGEYIPARELFGVFYRYLNMPLVGLSPGAPVQPPFALQGGQIAANICYEDAFGNEIRRNAINATLLVNLTNMAWFDGSWAAEQHAEMARARALENGRYLIRATNTGKTAIINPRGELVSSLPAQTRGVLNGTVRHQIGTTPYQRWGDTPVIVGWALALLALALYTYRQRYQPRKQTI
ncbi:apolipoprotein N-acyltransferase [Chitinibacter tainanensis]|uniref:apolipoprotein N-acyltransferase n=1 Tax=Chitinibacter tainanensis TaxID=230667 RepID=UPI0005523DF3|nr:apolipoprotein N-acyltransferase [Chitinibacter tainanensis]